MNAVIYCRVSSKEQIEGTSLDFQRVACEEFAQTKRMNVLRTFVEEGESAKFADRTQLLELIDFCQQSKGTIEVLLVWKVDRFARNVADHFSIKATLAKYGVTIVSVTEPIDTNPEGKLMETILAGFAQFDNDVRAARTVHGMRRKIKEGLFPWRPPLGYKSVTQNRERKQSPDVPDEPRFGLLRKAWTEFAKGAYTKAEIKRLMDNWGVTTKKGRLLSPQSVDNLFRNPYYAGLVIDPWSEEECQGQHVPMVSRGDFARVQLILAKRSHSHHHEARRPELPLRGLVRCPECSHFLTGARSKGRSKYYWYYHCYNKSCQRRGKGIACARVQAEFESFLPDIAPKTELMDKLGDMIVQTAAKAENSRKSGDARRRTALKRLDDELQELIRIRTQRLITDEEFERHRSALVAERHVYEARPQHDDIKPLTMRAQLASIVQPIRELLDTWKGLSLLVQSRFQRIIFPIGFAAGAIRTAELGLLFRLEGMFGESNSTLVPPTRENWNQICKEILELSEILTVQEEISAASERRV